MPHNTEIKAQQSGPPADFTENNAFKGFTNAACPFYPCHQGVKRDFNCLFCYCPLIAFNCPGPYTVLEYDEVKRKDCSQCKLPHDGYEASWNFIQKWLSKPVIWDGHPQDPKYLKAPKNDE